MAVLCNCLFSLSPFGYKMGKPLKSFLNPEVIEVLSPPSSPIVRAMYLTPDLKLRSQVHCSGVVIDVAATAAAAYYPFVPSSEAIISVIQMSLKSILGRNEATCQTIRTFVQTANFLPDSELVEPSPFFSRPRYELSQNIHISKSHGEV